MQEVSPRRAITAFRLRLGDCIEVMKDLDPDSIEAVVCDPPYGINFMGKEWDAPWKTMAMERPDFEGKPEHVRNSILFEEWSMLWLREAYRALKPGGKIKVFGGTRMFHRLARAMKQVGFEIPRKEGLDAWVFASGFPKSMNIKKQILKMDLEDKDALAEIWDGWGTALKPAWEPVVIGRKPLEGACPDAAR